MTGNRRKGSRMIGAVGWVVVLGLMLGWEGLALLTKGWPALSDMLRAVTRPPAGRFVLFAVWLWVGWHLFVRGWGFFLRGPGPPVHVPKPSAETAAKIAQQVVFPLLVFYVVLVGAVLLGARASSEPRETSQGGGWAGFARHAVVSAVWGWGVFAGGMAVYAVVADQPWSGLWLEAARDGAFLAFAVAVPAFLVLSLAQAEWHRRRRRRGIPGPPPVAAQAAFGARPGGETP